MKNVNISWKFIIIIKGQSRLYYSIMNNGWHIGKKNYSMRNHIVVVFKNHFIRIWKFVHFLMAMAIEYNFESLLYMIYIVFFFFLKCNCENEESNLG